jgi:hypothetical protein
MLRESLSCLALAALASQTGAQIQAYTFNGAGSGNQFGTSVRNAFDVDGDGFDDIIVGEPLANPNGANSGRARVYSGKTGAILFTLNGAHAGDQFGYAVAGVGDVDSDGFGDLVVGAPFEDYLGTQDVGSVYFFSGPLGTQTGHWLGSSNDQELGFSVAAAGDVDHDGVPDIAFGSPHASIAVHHGGLLDVISGATHASLHGFNSNWVDGELGFSVASAGDVDHDQHDDIVCGVPFGGNSTEGLVIVFSGATGATLYTKFGQSANSEFGFSVGGARDIDNDGWPDFLVGAPLESSNGTAAGRVKVFSGHTGSLMWTTNGTAGFHFGYSVSAVGDVDGDGFADYIAGSPFADHNGTQGTGVVRVFSGATGNVYHSFFGDGAGDHMGWSVSRGGDINNDGTSDILAGAPNASLNGANSGLARVWFMGCPSPATYCTAKTNSAGCVPQIDHTGVPTRVTGADDFTITASNVLKSKNGLLFWGLASLSNPFHGGTLCVGPPTVRTPIQDSGCATCGACQGSYSFHFSHAYMAAHSVQSGDTLYAQFWSRDPGFAPPGNYGLTDALKFTVCK